MNVMRMPVSLLIVLHCIVFDAVIHAASFEYDSKGKRDPFVPLLGQKKKAVTLEDVVSISDLTLEGIAAGQSGRRVVIVNGEMLKEGDKRGSLEVIKISDKGATVVFDGREEALALPEEVK